MHDIYILQAEAMAAAAVAAGEEEIIVVEILESLSISQAFSFSRISA